MPDRVHRVLVLGEPAGGGPVQRRGLSRGGAAQLQLQQVGEQVVVAEPGPPCVQRHHKSIRLLQILQHPLPAAIAGQQVGELTIDPLQHRGPQQKQPNRFGLPVQHLGQQVLGHRPLGAGELFGEPPRIGVPGQRQRRQPQPGRPPLGPLHQQRRIGQLHPGGVEQFLGLGHSEPQIWLADFGQLAVQPQPVQAQAHIMPGGEHEPQLLWRPHHQQLQLLLRLGRAQLVQVIDHEIDPVLQRRQVFQQPLGDRPPVQVRRGRQRLHQHQPRGRLAQRAEHRQPELLRIPLAAPDRHPRGAARRARLADPRSQQDRLPAAWRGRYHGHAG